MPVLTPPRMTNRLIQRITRDERNSLLSRCETIELPAGTVLSETDRPFQQAYFPLDALITTVASVAGHPPLEIAMIGNEGMLGSTLALGVNTGFVDAYVRGPGTVLRVSAANFRDALARGPRLQLIIQRYLYLQMLQMTQNTMCNRFHALDARLARWLLMTRDRVQSDSFFLIHKVLAELLGMRRSGITIAAGHLQAKRYIRYARGHITICDRPGLEMLACECYAKDRRDYDRVFA